MDELIHVVEEGFGELRSDGNDPTLHEELAARQKPLNFSDPGQREAHVRAFLAWLPKVLHDTPGIDWTHLPSNVMGYLIRSVADSPDAIPIAFAIGCAMDSIRNRTLETYSHQLASLLRRLRIQYAISETSEIVSRQIL